MTYHPTRTYSQMTAMVSIACTVINGGHILAIFFSIVAVMCTIFWNVYQREKTMER